MFSKWEFKTEPTAVVLGASPGEGLAIVWCHHPQHCGIVCVCVCVCLSGSDMGYDLNYSKVSYSL